MPSDLQDRNNNCIRAYARARPTYERFAKYICDLVSEYCGKDLIHVTEHRAKTVESFERKCQKTNGDGSPRYDDPLKEVTDLAGVRVITFVRNSVDTICSEIGKIFDVREIEDVGDRVYSQGKFGYQSKHLLVELGSDRKSLIENAEFGNLVCEIQVRTILQHAWAEMEHDIQYKSEQEIPLDLKKRFSALAGLIEIADREFQSIQADSEILKNTVKAELITDLTRQGLSEKVNAPGPDVAASESVAARDLVNLGRYPEAIEIYSRKITLEPASQTLYLGRAKARFLAGDVRGAIEDLDHVDMLAGNGNRTIRLRGIIERGDDPGSVFDPSSPGNHSQRLADVMQALEGGDGVRAFEGYTQLDEIGFNRAFSILGKAMCCILERDTSGARNFLAALRILPATPMAVNIATLRCVINVLEGKDTGEDEQFLSWTLNDMPAYSLHLSPLKAFLIGLRKKGLKEQDRIDAIFSKLEPQ